MKSPPLSRIDALNCIPIRNPRVVETPQDSGEMILSYPDWVRPWFAGLLKRLNKAGDIERVRKLQLDRLGTCVWHLVDGRSTVMGIIASFAEQHRLYPKEAEISVIQFLRELGRRGIIGMKQVSESADSSQKSACRSTER